MAQRKSKEARLSGERNIWIATVRPDGRPHLVPVWFVYVGNNIYVCTEPASVKGKNLGHNSRVALALEGGTHPVICEGTAQFLAQPWPSAVVETFRSKYDWDITEETQYTALVEITPARWLEW
jgi:F420H(2)-dependent biliverdin reductase